MLKIRKRIFSANSNRSPKDKRYLEEPSHKMNLSSPGCKNESDKLKSTLGFIKTHRRNNRPAIRPLNSIRSHNSSNKESKSIASNKNDSYQSQLGLLKEELELTWTTFKITEQHRSLFLSSLQHLPSLQSSIKIAREIDTIEKGSSNITSVLNTISIRELKLIEFQSQLNETRLDPTFYAKLIDSLRTLTLSLIDYIEIWKKDFNSNEQFLWQGQPYYEKMKTDSDFVAESGLKHIFCLYKSDPLFFGPTNLKKVGKRFFSVPYSSKLSLRMKRSQEILGFFHIKPEKTRSLSAKEGFISSVEPLNSCVSLFFQTEVVQYDSEYIKTIQALSKSVFDSFLSESITLNIEVLVIESCKEILLASLTLHSSSILDKIITEVLNEMIPSIARNSHTEVTDSEYLDIRNAILNEVFYEEILYLSSLQTSTLLSQYMTNEIFNSFDLTDLVVESINEEKQENLKIVFFVAENIMEEFISSEWSEDIAEVELINSKMESAWIGLPGHIQREIYWHQKANIIERVGEMVYFSVLNDFVGNIWLEGTVINILNEIRGKDLVPDEEVFVLKDPNLPVEDTKKPLYRKK